MFSQILFVVVLLGAPTLESPGVPGSNPGAAGTRSTGAQTALTVAQVSYLCRVGGTVSRTEAVSLFSPNSVDSIKEFLRTSGDKVDLCWNRAFFTLSASGRLEDALFLRDFVEGHFRNSSPQATTVYQAFVSAPYALGFAGRSMADEHKARLLEVLVGWTKPEFWRSLAPREGGISDERCRLQASHSIAALTDLDYRPATEIARRLAASASQPEWVRQQARFSLQRLTQREKSKE